MRVYTSALLLLFWGKAAVSIPAPSSPSPSHSHDNAILTNRTSSLISKGDGGLEEAVEHWASKRNCLEDSEAIEWYESWSQNAGETDFEAFRDHGEGKYFGYKHWNGIYKAGFKCMGALENGCDKLPRCEDIVNSLETQNKEIPILQRNHHYAYSTISVFTAAICAAGSLYDVGGPVDAAVLLVTDTVKLILTSTYPPTHGYEAATLGPLNTTVYEMDLVASRFRPSWFEPDTPAISKRGDVERIELLPPPGPGSKGNRSPHGKHRKTRPPSRGSKKPSSPGRPLVKKPAKSPNSSPGSDH
ncbi:hypothetical protein B0O99DRAFT_671927 [Bisporella sp. PMI_857]|nr:hypothetical protein B0O99DRAFT_671927 [Bisporella sp. PMI_857]